LGLFFPDRAIAMARSLPQDTGAWWSASLVEGFRDDTGCKTERRKMFEQSPTTEFDRPQAGYAKLQVALVLLLVALGVVLVKDRDFWFGSDQATESDAASSQSIPKADAPAAPAKIAQAPVTQPVPAKNQTAPQIAPKIAAKTVTATVPTKAATDPSHQDTVNPGSPAVATNRATLPPLDVEVVAGDAHHTMHPGSNVTKVQILSDSNHTSASTTAEAGLTTNAAERERLSAGSFPELRQTVDATYPLLGEHTRVQGSVILQAVIGVDGIIENLRVLSGPAILSTAAEQAVRQWHFKPYLQNGQPVETKAKITVNFSIRISDNAANAS
jgi:TonB family protein